MKKSPLLIIFLVVFIDLVGFGLVIPILPYYTSQFGAHASEVGFLMAIYSLMQLLFSPVWGRLSDVFGRRPVIMGSVLGTGIGMIILGKANSLEMIFLGRFIAGLFSGNISTAAAYIADVTSEENRAKGMGIIGAGYGLGFIFGPAIGGLLSVYGYGAPAMLAGLLCVCNSLFAFFALPEPKLDIETRKAHRQKKFDLKAIAKTLQNIPTRNVVLLFFIVTLGFTQLEASFALYMLQKFAYGSRDSGMLLGYLGLIMVALQGGLVHKLSRKFGEARLSQVGTASMAIGLVAMVLAPSFWPLIIAMTFVALGNGMNNPALMSLVSKTVSPKDHGSAMGVYQSAGALARIVGPPTAGFLFDRMNIAAPFSSAAVLMVLACGLGILFEKHYDHAKVR